MMLTGKHVRLEPLEQEDLEQTRLWANDRRLQQLMLRCLPVTRFDQQQWFERLARDESRLVLAVKSLSDGRHIGNTGFYHIDYIHRRAEFWILIGEPDCRGGGLGRDVTGLMLDFGFNSLNLNKIHLSVGSSNQAALALYQSLGFSLDGTLREHYFIAGRYVDVLMMSLLRGEYVT
jgi:diamine N-acetyltransferase